MISPMEKSYRVSSKLRIMGLKYNNTNMLIWMPPRKKNKVHVLKAKNKIPTTFQKSLKATLICGQLFSLIPVEGVYSDNAEDVRFTHTSWKCFYSALTLVGQMFVTIMCIYDFTYSGILPIIFYASTMVTAMMFCYVAKSWPSLVQHIAQTEELDPLYDTSLACKCNVTCAVVLMFALIEHVLALLSTYAETMVCDPTMTTYEEFVRHFYPWVFKYLPYSPMLGLISHFVQIQSTFTWNFSDLFVICMSYYLTSRLQHINEKLLRVQGKYLPQPFWKSTREDYCRATQLVRRVDKVINHIIFISFANNLFFICLQLFNTLENGIRSTGKCSQSKSSTLLGGYEAAVYYTFSLVYLISRSVAVSLIASQVNTASTVPAPVLYDVPSPVYCIEVQRFLDQVNADNVALTGLRFFSITRSLLLTVAGTIVTYELVMMQFNSQSSNSKTMTTLPNITTAHAVP